MIINYNHCKGGSDCGELQILESLHCNLKSSLLYMIFMVIHNKYNRNDRRM